MRKLFLIAVAVFFISGCATKSNVYQPKDATYLPSDTRFKVENSIDASGFSFSEKEEAFSLSEAMHGSMNAALASEGLLSDSGTYTVTTKINKYEPGNAFTRWLIPGAGATKLSTETVVLDKYNAEIARIPVERSIAFGGGFTIGAYKYVFDEVAKETVRVMKSKLIHPIE